MRMWKYTLNGSSRVNMRKRSSLPHTGSSRSTRHVQPMVEVEHGEVELNNAPSYAFFSFHPRHLEPMVEVLEHAEVEVHGEIMCR